MRNLPSLPDIDMGDCIILEELTESLEIWIRPLCFMTVGVTPLSKSLPILPRVPGVVRGEVMGLSSI